uniref:Desmoplakin n=1 Tax=Poecilia reticulata TaxID=8081 RepID=A0A3P9NXK2_POERE
MSISEAKKKMLMLPESADLLLEAQAATGHIIDPITNQKLTVEEACARGVVDRSIRDKLLAAESAAVGFKDPHTGKSLSAFEAMKKAIIDKKTAVGLRNEVSVIELVEAKLLSKSDVDQLNAGKLTTQDIEDRLRSYLRGSTCIAGVYDEASKKVLSIYQAMKNGLLRPGTTLELLEAQAASGFMIDPVNNLFLTVAEAYNKRLFGPEFKEKLLSAEKAVTGYKMPVTGEIISLFQAIENSLVEKGHGIRLLEAQIASGGIIDPQHSHRIDVNIAYKRGYFNEEMNKILTDESDDTKGFFDPNTEENLTYLELKKRCISDENTGLILLPIIDKKKQESSKKNTVRKRRVIIVDPETGKEMTVREAYNKDYIDYNTYLELSEQECEWEEITITAPDGSMRFVINDRSTGRQYDINDLVVAEKCSDSLEQGSHVSITLSPPLEPVGEVEPVGAIFDTEALEKISITEALNRGLVDSITAQRLLEAQACTGGIVNPTDGKRVSVQEASQMGLIANDMVTKLKPAQKAYFGFEDLKSKKKLSAALAIKEMWLPYEAGQRFLEFQIATGGLYDPEKGCRRSIEDALKMDWVDQRTAQKLQDVKKHTKNLTCPKSKLRISYKEILDNCLVEEGTGVKIIARLYLFTHQIKCP